MTSSKGPFLEQGDNSPDLDVLTGPPAKADVASEAARDAAEAPAPPLPEEPPEDVPAAETGTAEPLALPQPPENLEPAPEVDSASAGAGAIAVEDLPEEVAPETPPPHEPIAPEAAAEEAPTEEPQSETAIDATAAQSAIFEPTALAAQSAPADLAEPIVTDAGNDTLEPPTEPGALAAAAAGTEPVHQEPAAPPPRPENVAPPPSTPIVAPAIAAALATPAAVTLDSPAQPTATAPPSTLAPPPIAKSTSTSVASPWRVWLRRAFLLFIGFAAGYAALILILIAVYRYVDPPRSTVMLGLNLSGQSVDYEPVPITSISSYLQRAVVTSEDARFCRHSGVDWGALAEAMQDSRGGSTITMQTAKNLFLWPSRSYIRKAIEIPVALTIDFAWPKRRILEVYLNIAEWGPGVFGAEAAAQYHFGKPASRLTQHEAALLAASLPNPIAREAGDPGRITALLASRLRARMANSDAYVGCLGLRPMPRAEPERTPKSGPSAASKPAQRPQQPWQTRTEPAKPTTPFNPWQN